MVVALGRFGSASLDRAVPTAADSRNPGDAGGWAISRNLLAFSVFHVHREQAVSISNE